METKLSFEKVKEKFIYEAPGMLARRERAFGMTAHLAVVENLRKWQDNTPSRMGRSPMKVLCEEAMNEIRKIVNAWDVRRVGDLVSLVPYAFPAWVVDGRYELDLCESGWVLRRTH